MTQDERAVEFAGTVPELYDRYLVPLLFEPYAALVAQRVRARPVSRVLEVAAGTGAVTRALAAALPPSVSILATDLSPVMLDRAQAVGASREVTWCQADAHELPFVDASFDAVVCQFGAMFFGDRARAFHEVRRTLSPGGVFVFSVWDRLEKNELADVVTRALAALFPEHPPRFLARTPYGHHEPERMRGALTEAGFAGEPVVETITARSRARSAEDVAIAFCQGTPLRDEITALDPERLAEATEVAAQAITRRFGAGPIDAAMSAHVITVERPRDR